jgi:hypothetical protein
MPGLRLVRLSALLLSAVSPALAGEPRCAGDCDGNGVVPVGEVVLCVQIPLGRVALESCPNADPTGDGNVGIDDLIAAVETSITSCPNGPSPTKSATPEASSTPTATSTTSSPETPTPTATSSPPSSPTTTPAGVPIGGEALRPWLEAGSYLGWAAEGSIHTPNSPHPSMVRVFVNDLLLESLEEGGTEHPAGSAAVKEIYGPSLDLRGWAVTVKVQDDADNGRGWYWYERVGTFQFADGTGEVGCTGCHSQGTDYFRSPFPLLP